MCVLYSKKNVANFIGLAKIIKAISNFDKFCPFIELIYFKFIDEILYRVQLPNFLRFSFRLNDKSLAAYMLLVTHFTDLLTLHSSINGRSR